MTVTREVTVWCDGLPGEAPMSCGVWEQSSDSVTLLKAELIRKGWAIGKNYARCPECLQIQREQK